MVGSRVGSLIARGSDAATGPARKILEQESWRERAGRPRRDSSAQALIGALPAYPVLTVDTAAKLLRRSIQAANAALATLEKAGVVKVAGAVRRSRAFESPELLRLVTAFEKELAVSDEGFIGPPKRP
jgi:hypothetical protein